MGQEIETRDFSDADFDAFRVRLREETALLDSWFREGRFADTQPRAGFELEAWLVGDGGVPAPLDGDYLAGLNNPLVVPELARFNVELNSTPRGLHGSVFRDMQGELENTWQACNDAAAHHDARLAMIGILPTVEPGDLTLANMSPMQRYLALNDQVLRLRDGLPITLDITGRDSLMMQHGDVMLESAATSFQIHLKTRPSEAVGFYNRSKRLSAPMVAVAANSPWLFGRQLWEETRIPLFEQSVSVGGSDYSKRVTFGMRYAHESIMECFHANLARYPVLLPVVMDDPPEQLGHLRLHNGTIWRWTRPLIGFDDDGTPHIRIEHRVVPSGPSVTDVIANAALFFGLMYAPEVEPDITFEVARRNFYAAARDGLAATIEWEPGRSGRLDVLVRDRLLPAARTGLESLDVDSGDIDNLLGVIGERVETGRTGAAWQRHWIEKHGNDMHGLVAAYLDNQAGGEPVSRWSL